MTSRSTAPSSAAADWRTTPGLHCCVDDFGLRPLKGHEPEDLYEVISGRYERGSVLVTSNRDYTEWPAAFGDNPLLASAALDRLAHRAHLITITGRSYRAHELETSVRKAA